MLKYIELKTGYSDKGPAWIGRVKLSKSGRTVYFNGKAFKQAVGGGIAGNYFDLETGEEYWISNVKRDKQDRHWAGSGKITIEAAAVEEYLKLVGDSQLDSVRFIVSSSILPSDPAKFYDLEHRRLDN